VRVLQEGWLHQAVNEFNLGADLFQPDGQTQLRIWADNVFEVSWNGMNEQRQLIASGQYYIQAVSTDRLENRTVVTRPVTVLTVAVNVLSGTRLSPNPARDTVQIWARVRIAGAAVNAKVYNVAGELVAKLDFRGAEVATWNLTNHNGEKLSSGVYLVVILAADPQSGQVERQVLKLAVLQ